LKKKHNIDIEDRKILYGKFQTCLLNHRRSQNGIQKCDMSGNNANNIVKKFPQWIKYMKNYWKIKEHWCITFRDEPMHGHNTNNLSEVNLKIFKDIVLSRNKAYIAVALVDFICTSMEKYYTRRLRNVINGQYDTKY